MDRGSDSAASGTGSTLTSPTKLKKMSVKEMRSSKGDTEGGKFRPEVLSALLESTDRIVQEIDSVE